MRFAIWALVLLMPCLALGCAGQSAAHERQAKELEVRVRQLSTRCDRLEERLVAIEAVERYRTGSATTAPNTSGERPDLPTVKAGPTDASPQGAPHDGVHADTASDDSHRLTIVGEGTRVEARESGEQRAAAPATTSNKPTTRAAKRSPSSVPSAGTSSSGATP
jgi:hypothetical protein